VNLSADEALRYIDQKIARAERELLEWQRMRKLISETQEQSGDAEAVRLLEKLTPEHR
jgi:hypothetical protein